MSVSSNRHETQLAAADSSQNLLEKEDRLFLALWKSGAWRILPYCVLSVLGLALVIPTLPIVLTEYFAQRRSGGDLPVGCASFPRGQEPSACQDAHSDSVTWASVTSFVSQTAVSFLLTPAVGRWSDRHGRRPFFIASQLLSTLPQLVFFLSHFGSISIVWWYPAHVAFQAIDRISLSVAFVADLMPASLRGPSIGFVTATLAGALFVGPLVSARLSDEQVVWMLPAIGTLSVLWAVFFVPESTTAASRAAARAAAADGNAGRGARPWEPLVATWAVVTRSRLFATLTVVMMLVGVVQEGMQDLIMQYLQIKVGFGKADNAAVLMIVGVGGLVSQILLLRPLMHRLGEKWVLVLALGCQGAQQLLLAMSSNKFDVWTALVVGVFGFMSFPTLSSIESKCAAEHEQGTVQGALFGSKSLAQGLGPLLFAKLFEVFTRSKSVLPYVPGAPFLLGALLMCSCAVLAATLPRNPMKTTGSSDQDSETAPLAQGTDSIAYRDANASVRASNSDMKSDAPSGERFAWDAEVGSEDCSNRLKEEADDVNTPFLENA